VTPTNLARQQPDESRKRSPEVQALVDRIVSSEPYIQLGRDVDFYTWLDEQKDTRMCGRILATKGAGLAKACQFYRLQHVKRRGVLQEIPTPVVFAQIQQYGRPTDLYLAILEALNHSFRFGTLRDLRSRTWGTLKAYGVKLLIVDNADYLTLEAFNELVEIFTRYKTPIALAGTYYLNEILERRRYRHIHNSFLDFHDFRPLNKAETKATIQVWEETVLGSSPRLNLARNEGIVALLHDRSQGLLESLHEILVKIAVWQLDNRLSQIDATIIGQMLGRRYKPRVF
jgi:hypothetical protein